METTVIRNETSEYQNNKLLSNLVMGAKTDGNNIDFYIKLDRFYYCSKECYEHI